VTKQEDIADLKSGALKYEADRRSGEDDPCLRRYGRGALADQLQGLPQRQPFAPINLRRTVVWNKQGGDWKVIAWQVTRA
jgi:hypothetical protein